jgi:preprotein translocase subunit SecD
MRTPLALFLGLCAFLAACQTTDPTPPPPETEPERRPIRISLHVAQTDEREDYDRVTDERGRPLYIDPSPILTEREVWHADVYASSQRALLKLDLTAAGDAALELMTRAHVGDRLAVFLDDRLVVSPRIGEPVTAGAVYVDGDFDRMAAADLAARVNAQRDRFAPQPLGRPQP